PGRGPSGSQESRPMARTERTEHVFNFNEGTDFNEQLYEALKTSPWWMISIAIHVLLFVISSLFQGEQQSVLNTAPTAISTMGAAEPPPEEDVPPTPEE